MVIGRRDEERIRDDGLERMGVVRRDEVGVGVDDDAGTKLVQTHDVHVCRRLWAENPTLSRCLFVLSLLGLGCPSLSS